jgi:hypothetical protein
MNRHEFSRLSRFSFRIVFFIALAVLLVALPLGGNCNRALAQATKPAIPTNFTKPVLMFDNESATISSPSTSITTLALKLHGERGYAEEMVPLKDKKGLRRIAFMARGNEQTNCTPYADMYFDAKDRWISTEEFFTVAPQAETELGKIAMKISAALEAKGFVIGICEEGGLPSLWRISTPALVWYECEIFKKNAENPALAIGPANEPSIREPNPHIYGTAFFDANGKLVRVQAKSKVKMSAAAN